MLLLATPSALAQQGPTPTLDQVNAVARELYCPLCNGVRLDTCDLQACIQMRQVISDKLAAGVPKEQIKQEFVAEYGPKVLGEPPRSGLDLLAWIVPIVAIVAGAAWLLVTARRWTRAPAVAAGTPADVASSGPAITDGQADPVASGTDTYLAQVEADLNELE
jgi:cytochrome c-type biogenesis protein CcmH